MHRTRRTRPTVCVDAEVSIEHAKSRRFLPQFWMQPKLPVAQVELDVAVVRR